jgi:hypothetical protein
MPAPSTLARAGASAAGEQLGGLRAARRSHDPAVEALRVALGEDPRARGAVHRDAAR